MHITESRCEGEKGKKGGGGAENLAFGGTEGGVLGPGKAGEACVGSKHQGGGRRGEWEGKGWRRVVFEGKGQNAVC